MYTPTYLGEISLDEETLAHYGIKGMKWGIVKDRIKSGLAKRTSKIRKKLRRRPDEITTRYGLKRLKRRDDGRATSRSGTSISRSSYQRGLAAARQRARVNYSNMGTRPTKWVGAGGVDLGKSEYFRSMYHPKDTDRYHKHPTNYQAKTNEERNAMETVARNYDLDMWRKELANEPALLKAHDLVDTTYKNVNGKIVKTKTTKKKKKAGVMGADPRYN